MGTGEDEGHRVGPSAMGLSTEAAGFSLVPAEVLLRAGKPAMWRFRITGPRGDAASDFEVVHGQALDVVVVRRDLAAYQHLHPRLETDGSWSTPLLLPAAGVYKAVADFTPAGRDPVALGVDLFASGDFRAASVPAPATTAAADGHRVHLSGELVARKASELVFTVEHGGQPVTDLEPYLGAYGHLVALRVGDLAYVQVRPVTEGAGPAIAFRATAPSAGAYRLFLEFQRGGLVRTAGLTALAA